MSARKHCDRCGEEIPEHVVCMRLTIGVARGAYSVDCDEDLDICAACCKREPVLEGYFRAMHTVEFLSKLPAAKALPDTARGSALGNASVLPQ